MPRILSSLLALQTRKALGIYRLENSIWVRKWTHSIVSMLLPAEITSELLTPWILLAKRRIFPQSRRGECHLTSKESMLKVKNKWRARTLRSLQYEQDLMSWMKTEECFTVPNITFQVLSSVLGPWSRQPRALKKTQRYSTTVKCTSRRSKPRKLH